VEKWWKNEKKLKKWWKKVTFLFLCDKEEKEKNWNFSFNFGPYKILEF
jgi:hypothetical protein